MADVFKGLIVVALTFIFPWVMIPWLLLGAFVLFLDPTVTRENWHL